MQRKTILQLWLQCSLHVYASGRAECPFGPLELALLGLRPTATKAKYCCFKAARSCSAGVFAAEEERIGQVGYVQTFRHFSARLRAQKKKPTNYATLSRKALALCIHYRGMLLHRAHRSTETSMLINRSRSSMISCIEKPSCSSNSNCRATTLADLHPSLL